MSRRRARHSTVPPTGPPKRGAVPPAPPRSATPHGAPRRQVARIIETSDSSLLDVLDNLLNKGVVLNADVILALANVDLVYLKLSALLCAADRIVADGSGDAAR